MITGQNYIGSRRSAEGSVTYRTINPKLNTENKWECTEATKNEIDEATRLASQAFKTFRKSSPEERAAFLDAIADEIENLGDELIEVYCQESGLPQGRAQGERGRTMFQLRSFAEMLRKGNWMETAIDLAIPDREPMPKPDLRKTYIPLGPVVVFGSSNFPLAYSTAGGDTASALAAGCPVIVKSHPMHAGTGELVASAIIKAAEKTGMPNGVFSNLNSKGIEVGIQLVNDPKVKAVGFTGSIRGGRALYDIANQRPEPIPVFAEMGSINPVVISQGALESKGDSWADTYAGSITLGTGQFCTNPGLILAVDSPELDVFASRLAAKIVEIDPMCMLHPNIKRAYSNLKTEVTEQAGVTMLSNEVPTDGNFADQAVATVNGASFLENPKLHQEVFGPFSIIVKCENKEQLLKIIEGLEGQLTGTILAEDSEIPSLTDVVDELQHRVGRIIFNGVPTGVEVCPAMNHGGPYPSSTDSRFTAVGLHSIKRWIRPISYQDFPMELLPNELKNA
jgi:NADP-dependent aldehyde dehydrogenase